MLRRRVVASATASSTICPFCPTKELVTNSQAFTLNEAGELDIDLTKLFAVADKKNRLTVEYTNSPEWLMIQALPSMATAEGDNAVSLASAYYANAISRSLMNSSDVIRKTVDLWKTEAKTTENVTSLQSKLEGNAELKQMLLSETPWLMDATREAEQKQMLANYFDESQTAYRLADNFSRLALAERRRLVLVVERHGRFAEHDDGRAHNLRPTRQDGGRAARSAQHD